MLKNIISTAHIRIYAYEITIPYLKNTITLEQYEIQPTTDFSIRPYHFFKCLFIVPGTAADWKNDPAMVWRFSISLDNLHAVFPSYFAIWLHLFTLDC